MVKRLIKYTIINKYQPEPAQVGTPNYKIKNKVGINLLSKWGAAWFPKGDSWRIPL
jgi:hypothetical protein